MTFGFHAIGRVARLATTCAIFSPLVLGAQRQNGQLVGRVLSGDVAVPGAAIFASGGGATLARVDGRYRMSLPAGRYEIRAQRIGYSSARDSFTVSPGQTTIANFRLERALSMLEAVATVGTRGYERTVIDAPVPVDVIPATDLRATGRTATSRMLQALAPSVNAPRAGIAEGSDLIHPVTLRGLGPDQVLVLVNGRRRHGSALMNVNNSTGRGSTGTDLDAIPASMIDHVEILRDGAAAEYGLDAVAGVINVVLKSGVHGDATTTVGGNVTSFKTGLSPSNGSYVEGVHDGRTVQASIDKGVVFGERGFLHGDFEVRNRESSDRAYDDRVYATQTSYVGGGPWMGRLGDASSRDLALYLNGGNLFANGLEAYGNVGGSHRTMEATGRLQRGEPIDLPIGVYPSFILPVIHPTIQDYAGTLGVRGASDDWRYDLSTTYGRNTVDYEVRDSHTLGGVAGTFDAGRVRYGQSVTNADVMRNLNLFDEVRLAAGAEFRAESYGIGAGTPPVDVLGFPGFGAEQVVDRSRSAIAGHADVEADLSPNAMLGLALRGEHFSDVGNVGAVKAFFRVEPMPKLAIRGSAGRSNRAPSLAQSSYGNLFTDPGTGTFVTSVSRVDAPSAILAGSSTLRPELVTNLSLGFAAELGSALSVSADAYRVGVENRVVLLESLADATPSVPYFSSNAADTRTTGVDLSASYGLRLENRGLLKLTGGANLNQTSVTRTRSEGELGVGRIGVTRLEHGQPQQTLLASASYQQGTFGALLRTQRFGEVRTAGAQQTTAFDQTFGARFVTDVNVSVTLLRRYTLTAGADNIFDVYPDRISSADPFAIFPVRSLVRGPDYSLPYSAASPFGFNGRFVFGRLSLYL